MLRELRSSQIVSRFADDSARESRVASGKMLAALFVRLTGTMYIYKGEEL